MSRQQEPNAALAAFKIFLLVLFFGVLAGLGYWYLESRAPQNGTDETSSWPFINQTLGLQFNVPTGWQITENQESGVSGDTLTYDDNGQVIFDCKTHTELKTDDLAFLVADDSGACETLGRGGYWGDYADSITSSESLESICNNRQATTCEIKTNQNGLRYAYLHFDTMESWGQVLTDVDEYYFFHEGSDWDSIILSDEFFVQAGLDIDMELERLVQSLEFRK